MSSIVLEVIDEEIIKKIDKEVMVVPLFLDFMMEKFLKKNMDICKRFITSLLEIDISHCRIRGYEDEFDGNNVIIDVIISDNMVITLELDNHFMDIERYGIIRLNFNTISDSNNIGEDIIVPYSIKTNSIYFNNNFEYTYYLNYYKCLYSNDLSRGEKDYWLACLMIDNFSELNNIFSKFLDDGTRERLIRCIFDLSIDDDILDKCERIFFS